MMKWIWVLIVPVYLWINIPSLHDGLFHVIDNVQVTRMEAMYHELISGQFPVRYVDAFGHGAGNFIFKYYSPLIYYLGSIFQYLGFSSIKAVKLIYLLMTATGTIGMWVLLGSFVNGNLAKTLGTIAFITAPYFYHDFFHRGSLTEASALSLVPWLWWLFYTSNNRLSRRQSVAAAMGLAVIILTHSLTAIMLLGTLLLFLILSSNNLKKYPSYLLAIVLGCGLSAFSLIPIFAEKNLTRYESNELVKTGYIDHPIPISHQLLMTSPSKSAYLGITLSIVLALTTYAYFYHKDLRNKYIQILKIILIIAYGGIYLMSPESAWLWEKIIYLRYFQFPFRILTIVTTALAVAYAILIEYYRKNKYVLVGLIALLFVPLILNRSYYNVAGYQFGTKYTVDDPCMTNTWADEYLSIWTSECLKSKPISLVTPMVNNLMITNNGRTIAFDVSENREYTVSKYYFPEWVARDDKGQLLTTEPTGENGLIKVMSGSDSRNVVLKMERSKASIYGDTISLISMIICFLLLVLELRTKEILKKAV